MSKPQGPTDDGRRSGGGRRDAATGGQRDSVGGGRLESGRAPGSRRGGRPPEEGRAAELARPLERVLRHLPQIERQVVELRVGLADGYSRNLSDTARALGLTLHEAREIEQRAFDRIREVVPLQQLQKYLT